MQPRPAIVEDVPGQTEVFLIRFIGNEVSELNRESLFCKLVLQ